MKQTDTDVLENIKNALEFYRALGFERLPIRSRALSANKKISEKNTRNPLQGVIGEIKSSVSCGRGPHRQGGCC